MPLARAPLIRVALLALLVCTFETVTRLGAASPDTRFTLPQYSLGYFWDTPLGWTGLVDGAAVNRDAMQFASLAGFLRDKPAVTYPPADNVYVRFSGYPLLGSVLAPIVGTYAGFVIVNVLFWAAASLATYVLALRRIGSPWAAVLAALMTATAPAFAALAGQPLPYVVSYSLFAIGLLLFDTVGLFEKATPPHVAAATGLLTGASFLIYDVYMLPAFVVAYGLLRRMPMRNLLLFLVLMALPRVVWSGYWQLSQLPSYAHNESHPAAALAAWLDSLRLSDPVGTLRRYVSLAAHGALNIATAFLFWPVALALYELWHRRRSPHLTWLLAVAIAGFVPALFMVITWPHIPRWYAYGYPFVYILAAAASVRLAAQLMRAPTAPAAAAVAALIVAPTIVVANLDIVGYTKPMELLLFQPASWSYLWSP